MNRQQLHAWIKLELVGLPNGSQSRLLCPQCRGGSQREKSLSVTRDGGQLKYLCHRAQCPTRGVVDTMSQICKPSVVSSITVLKKDWMEEALTPHLCKLMSTTIGLNESELAEVKVLVPPDRLVLPVQLLDGSSTGAVHRKYDWLNPYVPGAKALNKVLDPAAPWIHFPKRTRDTYIDTLVLVEDVISAMKVSRVRPCASLMGTHLSDKVLRYLIEIGVQHLHIALDDDATNKAVAMRDRVGLHFTSCRVIILDKDAKDMNDTELQQTFGELSTKENAP